MRIDMGPARTLVLTSVLALAACGDGGAATATGTAKDTTTTPAATPSTSATTTDTTSTSTAAAPADIPAGAGTATTVDLDGDGAPDTLWLADVDGTRELGVATTAHGTSSVEFTSAAPQSAVASAAVLASGAPTVLLNTGRSVQLYVYRVENPGLVPVDGVTGGQYSFSLGFTDYGTGLTCEEQSDGLHLYGENATSDEASTWTVERTEVTVSAEHSVAQNGEPETVGTGLANDDPQVEAARGTTCGDAAQAAEPM